MQSIRYVLLHHPAVPLQREQLPSVFVLLLHDLLLLLIMAAGGVLVGHPPVSSISSNSSGIVEGRSERTLQADELVALLCLYLRHTDALEVIPLVAGIAANHLPMEGLPAQTVGLRRRLNGIDVVLDVSIQRLGLLHEVLQVSCPCKTLLDARLLQLAYPRLGPPPLCTHISHLGEVQQQPLAPSDEQTERIDFHETSLLPPFDGVARLDPLAALDQLPHQQSPLLHEQVPARCPAHQPRQFGPTLFGS